MDKAIAINHIVKSFGAVKALKDINLILRAGETLALIGHNGAGKTTLFKILLGFISPDSGSVEIIGEKPGSKKARQMISFLPESVAFPKKLTGREVLEFYARLKQVGRSEVEEVLDRIGLAPAADRYCGTYSKGMRQKLGLAQAMLGNPAILILDEPTSGLDPIARNNLYQLLDGLAANGTSILLSSHGLSEIDEHSDRIAIMREGVLVAEGKLDDIRKQTDLPLRIVVHGEEGRIASLRDQMDGKAINGAAVEIACDPDQKMQVLAAIEPGSGDIRDIEIHQPSLNEIYRWFTHGPQEQKERR